VGEDYYLACSSFEYFPGVPLFHSRDLVHWTQIGNVLDRPSQLHLPLGTPSSGGIYAPTLRHHDGRFWLIVTNVSGGGNLLVTATDPAGPWSDPIPLPGIHGIDPDLVWDDEDGTCYCTVAGVTQVRLDPYTGATIGEPYPIWSGSPGAKAPEAPHLYRIGAHWYLLLAEGGTERGHAVSVARGPTPAGPFEPCPYNPIVTHRGTDHPIQNTGHADLVQAPDGSWCLVLLGVRPGGGTPGWHVLGRETFLAPVRWTDDGWPIVDEVPVELPALPWSLHRPAATPIRDDFDEPEPHPRWISPRGRTPEQATTTHRPGWLTLRSSFVGRRQQHHSCRVRALVDAAAGTGGLAVRLDDRHLLSVEASGSNVAVHFVVGPLRTVVEKMAVPEGPVVLRIDVAATVDLPDPCTGPDTLTLGIEFFDGTFCALATLDGRYLSTEVAGGFTGRVIGLYATQGTVHADWFDYEPIS
jgi:beta-xylosidase